MTMSESIQSAATALYDRFTHEGMDRRTFMAELTRLAGGTAAASALLAGIAPHAAAAPIVPADHPQLNGREELLAAGGDRLRVYRVGRAEPARGRRLRPAVVVIHENRGLNEHTRDVARRLALQGYDAVAPDFLSLDGGRTPSDEDAARQAIGSLDLARVTAAGTGLVRTLQGPQAPRRSASAGQRKVGTVGFCWGGAMVHRLALAAGESLGAAVSFYGPAPEPAEAARLRTPLLVILAGRDERVNRTAGPYVAAAEAAGKRIRAITYPDVDHAFHNDTSAARYNRAAADQAWQETLTFFGRHLR